MKQQTPSPQTQYLQVIKARQTKNPNMTLEWSELRRVCNSATASRNRSAPLRVVDEDVAIGKVENLGPAVFARAVPHCPAAFLRPWPWAFQLPHEAVVASTNCKKRVIRDREQASLKPIHGPPSGIEKRPGR